MTIKHLVIPGGGPKGILSVGTLEELHDNNIWNIKSEVKRHIGKYNIFGLYKHEYYNNKEDFQFKVGVGIQL